MDILLYVVEANDGDVVVAEVMMASSGGRTWFINASGRTPQSPATVVTVKMYWGLTPDDIDSE